jgi:hypothetical protein
MPVVSQDLSEQGAVIDVLVGVNGPRQEKLEKMGFPVPAQVRIRAVVDTGSHVTGFDPTVFQALGIGPVGTIEIHTPSTGDTPHTAEQFAVSLSLVHADRDLELHHTSVLVISSEFRGADDLKGLIGRDILEGCLFVYDGERGNFSFGF